MTHPDDYSAWQPRLAVAKAAEHMNTHAPSNLTTTTERDNYRKLVNPPRPPLVSDYQRRLNEEAEQLPCSQGFGTGKNSRHWIPATLTGCVRCGSEAQDILNDQEHNA